MKEVLICSPFFLRVLVGPKTRMILHQLSGLLRRNQRSFSVAKFMQMLILHFYRIVCPGTRFTHYQVGYVLVVYFLCSKNDLQMIWKKKRSPNGRSHGELLLPQTKFDKSGPKIKWSNPGGFQCQKSLS